MASLSSEYTGRRLSLTPSVCPSDFNLVSSYSSHHDVCGLSPTQGTYPWNLERPIWMKDDLTMRAQSDVGHSSFNRIWAIFLRVLFVTLVLEIVGGAMYIWRYCWIVRKHAQKRNEQSKKTVVKTLITRCRTQVLRLYTNNRQYQASEFGLASGKTRIRWTCVSIS